MRPNSVFCAPLLKTTSHTPLGCTVLVGTLPVNVPKLYGAALDPRLTVRSTAPSPFPPAFGSMRIALLDPKFVTQTLPFTSTETPRGLRPLAPSEITERNRPLLS